MARSTIIKVEANTWTELTAGDVTNISLYHRGGGEVLLQGSTSSSDPTDDPQHGVPLKREHYGYVNEALTDLFPEIAAVRVFAYTFAGPAYVLVKHA